MTMLDDFSDSPSAVLAEVLEGVYRDLLGEIEPGKKQAHVIIPGPDNDWVVSIRPIEHKEAKATAGALVEA